MADSTRPAGRSLKRTGLILMIVGALVGVASVIAIVAGIGRSVIDGFTGPVYTAPASTQVLLKHRKYLLLEQVGSGRSGGLNTAGGSTAITAQDLRVAGPDGSDLPTAQTGSNYTISRDNDVFASAVSFDVPAAGNYQVTVAGPASSRFILAPDVASSVRSVAGWFAGAGLGAAAFVVGFIMLLVGFGQQRSGPLPPAGWYPDPGDPSRGRYWDGSGWV